MNKIIKFSIIFLVLVSILISGCIDSEKPSEIDGANKPVQSDAPREWIEMGPYDSVGKPADIGGRLVFYAEKNEGKFIVDDGTEESTEYYLKDTSLVDVGGKLAFKDVDGYGHIVYDGKEVGNQYDDVWPPVSVGGKLAYMARYELNIENQYNGRKEVVVYYGEEHGTEYEGAARPVDVGGKLAYHAYNVNEGQFTSFVILDGERVSVQYNGVKISEFKKVGELRDVGGKLAFKARVDSYDWTLFYDGKQFQPKADYLKEIGGKLAYFAEKGNRLIIMYDGNEIGTQYDGIEYFMDVDDKLTYIATKDGKEIIVFNGDEIGTQYDRVGYTINIGNKLAYAAEKDGNVFIVYDGIEVGNQYDEVLDFNDVGGKLAYKAKKGGEYFIIMEK